MLETVMQLTLFAGTGAAAIFGYVKARTFVRQRLRFVEVAQTPIAPVVAGSVAALASLPIVAIIPLIGVPTALIFGVSVGAGVLHGARDIRRHLPPG
ncbi:MAG TPA: hypothetical protein VGA37_11195 [Gemmatimonadales bacterium]